MPLELDIQNPANYRNIPSQENLIQWVDCALSAHTAHKENTTISVVLRIVDESESQALNQRYRHKNSPTNVLSFPFDMPELNHLLQDEKLHWHLGDLVLCAPIIEQEALQQHKTLMQHLAHMVIHGMLHLQGYDHLETSQAEAMESLEKTILQQLGFPDPYETQTVSPDDL